MRWLLSILLVLTLGGCSAAADTKAAEKGIAGFHQAMNGGQYAAIYDQSAKEMKETIKRDEFVQFLGAVVKKLGPFKSGKSVGWNVNATTDGKFVTLNYESHFDRGPGTEQFVFRMNGEQAILAGYHVNSNLLVLN